MKTVQPWDVAKILAETKFRPFEKSDFVTFQGVESDSPLISIDEDSERLGYTIIIDSVDGPRRMASTRIEFIPIDPKPGEDDDVHVFKIVREY